MRKALIITGIYVVCQFAATALLLPICFFRQFADGTFNSADVNEPHFLTFCLLVSAVASAWLTLWVCREGYRKVWRWNMPMSDGIQAIWWGVLGMLPLSFLTSSVVEVLDLPDLLGTTFQGMVDSLEAAIVLVIVGPVCEEVCFRYGVAGQLLQSETFASCSPRLRAWIAIGGSAAIFGIIHLNPAQSLSAFLIGLYLGWLYLKTGSLWTSIACHICNNALAVAMLASLGPSFMMQSLFPDTLTFVGAMLLSAVLLALIIWRITRLKT